MIFSGRYLYLYLLLIYVFKEVCFYFWFRFFYREILVYFQVFLVFISVVFFFFLSREGYYGVYILFLLCSFFIVSFFRVRSLLSLCLDFGIQQRIRYQYGQRMEEVRGDFFRMMSKCGLVFYGELYFCCLYWSYYCSLMRSRMGEARVRFQGQLYSSFNFSFVVCVLFDFGCVVGFR